MKTRNIYIAFLLAVLCVAPMFARQFEKGEMLYVNADQSGREGSGNFNWSKDGAKLFLYIWKDVNGQTSNQDWITLTKENGNLYSGSISSARDYNRCIVVRKSSIGTAGNWDNKWDQTGDITIPEVADRNSLDKFWKDGDGSEWQTYTPAADKIATYASAMSAQTETIVVCPSAMGGPFSLRVKLNQDKTKYDYNNVQCHGWYTSTNGTSWSSVDHYAGKTRDGEKDKDILNNNLPASGPVYFYLHSAKAAGRRLIKVTTDGATDCDLDCTITAFEVAASAVNVDDNTYTLDGMVAFGKADGNLVISYQEGSFKKDTTIKNAATPQTFSLRGLPANGNTAKVTAKFSGSTGCSKTLPNVKAPSSAVKPDAKRVDVLVGQTATLKPEGANPKAEYKWMVGSKDTAVNKQQLVTPAYNTPNTVTYTYIEYSDPEVNMKNLMTNGDYETPSFNYGTKGEKSTISDYIFWGQYPQTGDTPIDFYTNTAADINPSGWADNGFAVVKNTNNFFYTFAKVTPRDGDYFAMFDAASDGVEGKKAWLAQTANNENLKLRKGTTYLFSFWAANINNYGEMDNAAKLQFQIEYNGKTEKLGSVLDLGSAEFRNNRWHQCSATFTAKANADNVTISVINLNTNELNTGNDFALDDIQFRAVSSPTRTVSIYQEYTVVTHEPKIYQMTAVAQPMACDETEYEVKIGVEYTNPKGKLVVEDLTTSKKVWNKEVSKPAWDSKTWHRFSIKLDTLTAKEHKFKAYFEWPDTEKEAKSIAPEFTVCCTEGRVYRKWDNVIFVDNHDSLFVGYQWYKNGNILEGETLQRLYTGAEKLAGTKDLYHCVLTHKDGQTEKTCQYTFDEFPSSAEVARNAQPSGVLVYPTKLPKSAAVTVVKAEEGSVSAVLTTITGQTITVAELRDKESTLPMPNMAGIYLLQLQGTSTHTTVKINVY